MPAYHPAVLLRDGQPAGYYWAKTPHSAAPHVLPADLFDLLGGTADAAALYSDGSVDRRFYATPEEALAALDAAMSHQIAST
jgi:hypothetical protein